MFDVPPISPAFNDMVDFYYYRCQNISTPGLIGRRFREDIGLIEKKDEGHEYGITVLSRLFASYEGHRKVM